jgi:hypothetical protein
MLFPSHYKEEIHRVLADIEEDLKYLISRHFENNYIRQDDDPMIKIQSILGTPIIGGLRVDEDTDKIQCQYCFWDGKSLSVNPKGEWIDILENEILTIYEGLYEIWKRDQ